MTRKMAYHVVALAVLALGASTVFSEQPDRQELARELLMTRYHWFFPAYSGQFNGVWSFDPDTGATRRLRPLPLTGEVDWMIPHVYSGYGAPLAAVDDRLVIETWPHFLEIEVPSWRLLRRYPPGADYQPVGWAVEGPMLGREEAKAVGLEPGLFGFPQCMLGMLTAFSDGTHRLCEPHQFPGAEEPQVDIDTSVMLRRSLDPVDGGLELEARVSPLRYFSNTRILPVLSFDLGRGAFWRTGPRSIYILPVTGGEVGPPSAKYEPDLAAFADPELEFRSLYYHPLRKMLFGTIGDEYGPVQFLALDEQGSLVETYDIPVADEDYSGWPMSFASLRPAPSTKVQTIPVVSRTRGRNGTTWSTALWLYNPSGEATSAVIRRVIEPAQEREVDLPAHGSVAIPDALAWIGGGPGGDGVANDALVITAPARWGAELVAVSRTFTTGDGGGSYGQAVPAVPGRVGYSNHLPYDEDGTILYMVGLPSLRASNVVLDRRVPGRFRHNLGIVNDHDTPVRLTLVWGFMDAKDFLMDYRPEDAVQRISVAPHSVRIVNLEERFPPSVRDAWPPRVGVYGDRPALLWLSMVDNLTGDATFVPYTNLHYAIDSDDDRSAIPVVAHTPGREGTLWTTDLYGCQGNIHTPFAADFDTYDRPVTFFQPERRATQCGGAALAGEISDDLDGDIGMPLDDWAATMTAIGYPPSADVWAKRGWRMIFPDVIQLFAECAGEEDIKGGLEVSTASWTSGYSRTYTTRDVGGTYGSMLPLYPPHGWPVQHFAGIEVSDEFRVNVGFFNGDHEHAITHRVTLYAADGTQVASSEFDLAPLRSKMQPLERLLGLPDGSLPEGTYGLTVLPLDDGEQGVEGRSWAYVSIVDNITGDPTNWW